MSACWLRSGKIPNLLADDIEDETISSFARPGAGIDEPSNPSGLSAVLTRFPCVQADYSWMHTVPKG